MPFESSLPLVVTCLFAAIGVLFIWLRMQSPRLLAVAALLGIVSFGAFIADCLVETDREHLQALFPRLARAAEKQDLGTIMAALDPDLRPRREEAEKVLKQVRPNEVVITSMDVVVEPARKPPEAVAKLIVRVTGNVIDKSTPGTALVGVTVLLRKKDGQWLVTDAEGEPVRPGQRK